MDVLVGVTVLAILVSLAARGAANVRRSALEQSALASVKSHLATFSMYAATYHEAHPFLVDPRHAVPTLWRCEGRGVERAAVFCDAIRFWNVPVADEFYSGDCFTPFRSAWKREAAWHTWNVWRYPLAFVTDPTYWDLRTRTAAPAQFRATRIGEVRYPGAKVALVEDTLFLPSTGAGAVGFSDGHAAARSTLRLSGSGDHANFGELEPIWAMGSDWYDPLGATRHGVRGRDTEP